MVQQEEEYDASKQPTIDLFSHVLQKGWQAGAVIGILAIPAIGLYRKKFDVSLLKTPAYTGLAMTAIAGLLGGFKYSGMDEEGLQDRVYRLHYNQGQIRTDNFSQVGAIAGFAASFAFGNRLPLLLLGGASVGTAAGIAAHLAFSTKQEREFRKMLHELKH